MPLQSAPLAIANTTFDHPAELFRNLIKTMYGGRAGTLQPSHFSLTPVVGALQLTISSGGIVIPGTETAAAQGSYFAWSESDQTLAWPGPSASDRIDSLILRIADDQYGTIPGANGASWAVVQGVPGASPVARADSEFGVGGAFYVPGAWLRYANVRVNTTDTTELNATRITKLVGGLRTIQTQKFTASGTWNKPIGAREVKYEVVAGGGGGGGAAAAVSGEHAAASGGGAGGTSIGILDASSLAVSVTVTVGAGGAGGAAGANNGVAGGQSSFGGHAVASGGAAGNGSGSSGATFGVAGAAGGIGTTGDVLSRGGAGGYGFGGGNLGASGNGGDSHYGGGPSGRAAGTNAQSLAGVAADGYGAGGSGGLTTSTGGAAAGGAGAAGIVVVTTYF